MTNAQQLTLSLDHRPALGGEDFFITPVNEEAVRWLDQWPDWSACGLCISGPRGCGKTHLAHVFQADSNALAISPDDLSERNARSFVSENPALVIDNASNVKGKEQEKGLFHLLNILNEIGKKILLLADSPPGRWSLSLPDLQSRLNALPHASIQNPDESLIAAVMVKQFHDRQLHIDEDVVSYLLPRMERSFETARTLVNSMDQAALTEKRRITVPLARQALNAYRS